MADENRRSVKLPSGKEAIIKEWAPAWVAIDLRDKAEKDREKFLFEALIIDLAGKTKDIYAEVRNLTIADYKFLDNELLKLMTVDPK